MVNSRDMAGSAEEEEEEEEMETRYSLVPWTLSLQPISRDLQSGCVIWLSPLDTEELWRHSKSVTSAIASALFPNSLCPAAQHYYEIAPNSTRCPAVQHYYEIAPNSTRCPAVEHSITRELPTARGAQQCNTLLRDSSQQRTQSVVAGTSLGFSFLFFF